MVARMMAMNVAIAMGLFGRMVAMHLLPGPSEFIL